MIRTSVRLGTLLVLALALTACAGTTSDGGEGDARRSGGDGAGGAGADEDAPGEEEAAASEGAAGALDVEPPTPGEEPADPPPWPWEAGDDVEQAVGLDELRDGGPPPDGIPPIDAPVFEAVASAGGWLGEADPVMIVEVGGEVRGYPLAILTFHEIVNDTIGGVDVVVTYCPLCNSGLAFVREVDDRPQSFGTSGRLWRSNLVMYDRATRSLWSQFTGEAIIGPRTGEVLERLPMQIVGFAELAERWPDAPVLSRDTGVDRPYGDNPYVGYESSDEPFLFDGETGGPLPQMARVVTAGGEEDPVAYPWDRLAAEGVVSDEIAGTDAVVLWAEGAASALGGPVIADAEDVGQAGVFRAEVDGEPLRLEPDDGRFVDDGGTTWSVTGVAIDGPREGTQLERLPHDDTFWFVQFAFRPDTRVEEG